MRDGGRPGISREGRVLAVALALAYLVGSLLWWLFSAVWIQVVENPPSGSWRLQDDPWQEDAIMWLEGGASALAAGALAIAVAVRRPVPWMLVVVTAALAAQVVSMVLMHSGGLPPG